MVGLECIFEHIKILLLGVYLPYNSVQNFEDFLFSLGKIRTIIEEFDSPYVFVLGDFNVDIKKQTSFGKAFFHLDVLYSTINTHTHTHTHTHIHTGLSPLLLHQMFNF